MRYEPEAAVKCVAVCTRVRTLSCPPRRRAFAQSLTERRVELARIAQPRVVQGVCALSARFESGCARPRRAQDALHL